MAKNYEQSSARRGKPRFDAQARALAFSAKGGEPAERYGFTMAEILLSLTIIGVVAAITLPSLTGNINERTWNTKRKALLARFSQAVALMPTLSGFGTLKEIESEDGAKSIDDTAAMSFVTNGLSKVLKINNICDNEHLQDCGIPKNYIDLIGSKKTFPTTLEELNPYLVSATGYYGAHVGLNSKAAAFETINGDSIAVFYNPLCRLKFADELGHSGQGAGPMSQLYFCANFIFDLNGVKGPNKVGKDIGFITTFYPFDPEVVSPIPLLRLTSVPYNEMSKYCKKRDSEARAANANELASLFFNSNLINTTSWLQAHIASSTPGTYHDLPSTLHWPDGQWWVNRALQTQPSANVQTYCVK